MGIRKAGQAPESRRTSASLAYLLCNPGATSAWLTHRVQTHPPRGQRQRESGSRASIMGHRCLM